MTVCRLKVLGGTIDLLTQTLNDSAYCKIHQTRHLWHHIKPTLSTPTKHRTTNLPLDSIDLHYPGLIISTQHANVPNVSYSTMGNSSSTPSSPPLDDEKKCKSSQKVGIKSGKKICCCCPETKQARDACILANGEEDADCQRLIELHKECLRGEGFDVK